jgi:hypothetical protein
MRRTLFVMTISAALIAAGGAWAESLNIKVDSVDPAKQTISGANPEMASDVRTFHYREQTAGIKLDEINPGDEVNVEYDDSSGTNWLIAVTKK